MTTIHEFRTWCEQNKDLAIHTLPQDQWELIDAWRWAVAQNTRANAWLATPAAILTLVDSAMKLLGPEVLGDIQRTFDER